MYATRLMTRKQQFNVLLAESTNFFLCKWFDSWSLNTPSEKPVTSLTLNILTHWDYEPPAQLNRAILS